MVSSFCSCCLRAAASVEVRISPAGCCSVSCESMVRIVSSMSMERLLSMSKSSLTSLRLAPAIYEVESCFLSMTEH